MLDNTPQVFGWRRGSRRDAAVANDELAKLSSSARCQGDDSTAPNTSRIVPDIDLQILNRFSDDDRTSALAFFSPDVNRTPLPLKPGVSSARSRASSLWEHYSCHGREHEEALRHNDPDLVVWTSDVEPLLCTSSRSFAKL